MNINQVTRKTPALEEQTFINLVRVTERMTYGATTVLRERRLSGPLYNVLRILRGAGDEGLSCQKIGERLITRVPDLTRLLDRLESAGFVTRERGTGADRRVVITRITRAGLDEISALDKPIEDAHRKQLSNLSPDEIRTLNDLLLKIIEG